MPKLNFALIGAGRIGQVHAANIARSDYADLVCVADAREDVATQLAARYGARVDRAESACQADDIDAVLIASSTDTHAQFCELAARANKAVLCEKPIDLDLVRADACLAAVAATGVPFGIGFNRRFDKSFSVLEAALRRGEIGQIESLSIISRDPAPPPADYITVSGGLFRDMMIHDFDTARWLLGDEPVEVFATGSCLIDPSIGEVGDIDTAVAVLKTASGVICQISNSRRAVYGYDQRIEAFGSKGMLRAENQVPSTVETTTAEGIRRDPPEPFFLERYGDAYKSELKAFVRAVVTGDEVSPSGADGRAALALAEAAAESVKTGLPVSI